MDASNAQSDTHMKVVYETLDGLKVGEKDVITVLNKQDKIEEGVYSIQKDDRAVAIVKTAIKKKIGIEDIVNAIEEVLKKKSVYIGIKNLVIIRLKKN